MIDLVIIVFVWIALVLLIVHLENDHHDDNQP